MLAFASLGSEHGDYEEAVVRLLCHRLPIKGLAAPNDAHAAGSETGCQSNVFHVLVLIGEVFLFLSLPVFSRVCSLQLRAQNYHFLQVTDTNSNKEEERGVTPVSFSVLSIQRWCT